MQAQSLQQLSGIGPALAHKYNKLGIESIDDLVNYLPRRYDDYSNVVTVNRIKPGLVTLQVTISNPVGRYSKRGLHITEALASDETGSVKLIWFNQPYRKNALKPNQTYYVSGEFAKNYKFFAITNPSCEPTSSFPINTARLVPVYRVQKGVTSGALRKSIKEALHNATITETLPAWLLDEYLLIGRSEALVQMHFPDTTKKLEIAKRRIGFEEVFELGLASELNRVEHTKEHSLSVPLQTESIKKFVSALPFKLTDDQRVVSWEILKDMAEGRPMNRLVEGDVGSGKTVIAAISMVGVLTSGMQAAFMAPTELLARQHFKTLKTLFERSRQKAEVVLLVGSLSKAEKKRVYDRLSSKTPLLVVGTHALFQDSVAFHDLALIVVDEQHRFGVEQRKKLQSKAKSMPHVLHMTATPIPRSLALTLYGELDVSIIRHKPQGREPVQTSLHNSEGRSSVYAAVGRELAAGSQAFVVCPQIEDEEGTSVKKIYELLLKQYLKPYTIGLLHGKMPADEKESVMRSFNEGHIKVLVATTVIEVGVDVPNATVMVVEAADSFGLAQIHQLRGRVGRGEKRGYCYLITSDTNEPSQRLRLLEYEHDGFTLAEYDLKLRGPGAIYGTSQHGALDLRVAKLTDVALIKLAISAAREFVSRGEKLVQYPQLEQRVRQLRTVTNLN